MQTKAPGQTVVALKLDADAGMWQLAFHMPGATHYDVSTTGDDPAAFQAEIGRLVAALPGFRRARRKYAFQNAAGPGGAAPGGVRRVYTELGSERSGADCSPA